jgi:hypothetical protein
MANRDADAIAGHAVEIKAQQDVTNISHVISEPHDEHRNARKTWNLAHMLDSQWVALPRSVFSVCCECSHALARHEVQAHSKNADARAWI